jgi:hypothetical protein
MPPSNNLEFCNIPWHADVPRIEDVPITVLGDTFSTTRPISELELPIYTSSSAESPEFSLVLDQVELEDVTLDPTHTLVGEPLTWPGRTISTPSAELWMPGGRVRGWIPVEATRAEIVEFYGATLCGLISGDSGDSSTYDDDCASPIGSWPTQPSEIPGTEGLLGWQLEAEIGAGAVTIVE